VKLKTVRPPVPGESWQAGSIKPERASSSDGLDLASKTIKYRESEPALTSPQERSISSNQMDVGLITARRCQTNDRAIAEVAFWINMHHWKIWMSCRIMIGKGSCLSFYPASLTTDSERLSVLGKFEKFKVAGDRYRMYRRVR